MPEKCLPIQTFNAGFSIPDASAVAQPPYDKTIQKLLIVPVHGLGSEEQADQVKEQMTSSNWLQDSPENAAKKPLIYSVRVKLVY